MTETLVAVYDGAVFRPQGEVNLEPNTRVHLTVETEVPSEDDSASFLKTARSLHLEGPADFSTRIDEYLYEGAGTDEQ